MGVMKDRKFNQRRGAGAPKIHDKSVRNSHKFFVSFRLVEDFE
jgi:hypothetical protein